MATTHLELVRTNFARRSDIQGELREIDEAATNDKRKYTEEETARIDEIRSELSDIDARIQRNLELELRTEAIEGGIGQLLGAMVDRDSGDVVDTRTIGEIYTESDEFRDYAERGGPRGQCPQVTVEREIRTVTTLDTAGALVQPQRLGRFGRDILDRRVFLADLLPTIPLGVGAAEIVSDVTPEADIEAASAAEGSTKKQSGVTFDVVMEPTPTVAHWHDVTRQVAADATQVMAYLDGRLRYGLRRKFDNLLVNGAGGTDIVGLLNRPNINTVAPSSAQDQAVTIRKAITELELSDAVPEIVVLNPIDAEAFDLSNYDDNGLHAVPNLTVAGSSTAWGMRMVKSNALAAGTALLIDPMAVAILDRQQASAYMTDSDGEKFKKNIITILLELRAGLGVFEAPGICEVTFNVAS